MILLFLLTDYLFERAEQYDLPLKAGRYKIECYGAQGGGGYDNKQLKSSGGKGAYVYGELSITGKGVKLIARVGGQGSSGKGGPNKGGFNGGGDGGADTSGGGDDASGGGGGASDIRYDSGIDTRIMVAAGGSGGAATVDGAPGGTLKGQKIGCDHCKHKWAWDPFDCNSYPVEESDKTTQVAGHSERGKGGKGKGSTTVPGSGGGGGWYGGVSSGETSGFSDCYYKSIAHSGSSYISGYQGCIPATVNNYKFENSGMKSGQREKDGMIKVTTLYECKPNCGRCTSSTNCFECLDSYKLYNNNCYDPCPSGTREKGSICEDCKDSHCTKCTSAADKCEICDKNFFLLNENGVTSCVENCKDGYIGIDGKCVSCNTKCSTCSQSIDYCDSCKGDNFLYKGECYSECSILNDQTNNDYFGKDNINKKCQKCTDTNCIDCSNDYNKCNKCSDLFYVDEKTHQCLRIPTPIFTNSQLFTCSVQFSDSNQFSASAIFSSNYFTHSKQFTGSDQFSNSIKFTNSKMFSDSDHFSGSVQFSKSNQFSDSNKFSKSNQFSDSNKFSKSNQFSNSNQFSKTFIFSESNLFSISDPFSRSFYFSNSDHFTKSDQFSNSNYFSYSLYFTNSNQFSKSEQFSKSIQFSNSYMFSKSYQFSQTNHFTKTNYFSRSYLFTISDQFLSSFYFTNSEYFTNSNVFSVTSQFSETYYFSKSELFSNTEKFSMSNYFTNSNQYTKSVFFTNSNQFTKTDKFTFTHQFSASNNFTNTDFFTESNQFTQSKKFSLSNHFTQTKQFTYTLDFSNSEKFTSTDRFSFSNCFHDSSYFTNSNQFTSSIHFSNTEHFTSTDKFSNTFYFSNSDQFTNSHEFPQPEDEYSCLISYENESFALNERCVFSGTSTNHVDITLIRTIFESYVNESAGGAIYVHDSSMHFNDSEFINCVSLNGCGGAIYVNNTIDMNNDIQFNNLTFTKCKATYGGAVFIYSILENYNVSVTYCLFDSNQATDENKKNGYFGGSGAFICAKNLYIFKCNFINNKGSKGGLKIYNKFNENERKLNSISFLENIKKTIIVSNCNFELNDASKNSIYYVNGKDGSMINIINCKFNSKLNRKNDHIYGEMLNVDSPDVSIKSCRFQKSTHKVKITFIVMISNLTALLILIAFIIQKINHFE